MTQKQAQNQLPHQSNAVATYKATHLSPIKTTNHQSQPFLPSSMPPPLMMHSKSVVNVPYPNTNHNLGTTVTSSSSTQIPIPVFPDIITCLRLRAKSISIDYSQRRKVILADLDQPSTQSNSQRMISIVLKDDW